MNLWQCNSNGLECNKRLFQFSILIDIDFVPAFPHTHTLDSIVHLCCLMKKIRSETFKRELLGRMK